MAEIPQFPRCDGQRPRGTEAMKFLSTLTLGTLLVGGAAFAATAPTTPQTSAPTATPAPSAQPAVKHHSAMHCEKLAKNKGLSGDDETKFVKDCKEGRKSH
jgi:Spy/CpxP family protein refolding chaperone